MERIRIRLKRKIQSDRTPCEALGAIISFTEPIDPSKEIGLQKWCWLKEMMATLILTTRNRITVTVPVDTSTITPKEASGKIRTCLAGMPRDTGGYFKCTSVKKTATLPNGQTMFVLKADWADDAARKAWAKNADSMRVANRRFRDRQPELIAYYASKYKLRKKHEGDLDKV